MQKEIHKKGNIFEHFASKISTSRHSINPSKRRHKANQKVPEEFSVLPSLETYIPTKHFRK